MKKPPPVPTEQPTTPAKPAPRPTPNLRKQQAPATRAAGDSESSSKRTPAAKRAVGSKVSSKEVGGSETGARKAGAKVTATKKDLVTPPSAKTAAPKRVVSKAKSTIQ